jgi:hypothetical protein
MLRRYAAKVQACDLLDKAAQFVGMLSGKQRELWCFNRYSGRMGCLGARTLEMWLAIGLIRLTLIGW